MTVDDYPNKTTAVFTPFVTQTCKGIAVMMMLAHHLWDNPQSPLYSATLYEFAAKCKVCVAVFLMLSGAGLSLAGCSWMKTYLYRIPQLLLNYWIIGLVFVSIGMLFFGMTFDAAYPNGTRWTFWLQLFGVNWFTPTGGFNPTWWFMDAIMPLYCVVPILYMLVKWNPLAIVLVSFFATLFPWDFHWWLIPFAFGMAAVATNSFECLAGRKRAVIGLILFSVLLGFSYCYVDNISQHFMLAFFLIAIVCSLNVICGRMSKILFAPLAFVGRHSMNIFFLHTFFLIWYGRFFTTHSPIVVYSILFCAALLSSIVVEGGKKLLRFNAIIAFMKEKTA